MELNLNIKGVRINISSEELPKSTNNYQIGSKKVDTPHKPSNKSIKKKRGRPRKHPKEDDEEDEDTEEQTYKEELEEKDEEDES